MDDDSGRKKFPSPDALKTGCCAGEGKGNLQFEEFLPDSQRLLTVIYLPYGLCVQGFIRVPRKTDESSFALGQRLCTGCVQRADVCVLPSAFKQDG